ncbi:polypeptide N-acetylgalactosaminyltransferase 1-like [Ostrea edulis]|uniref:polypeptide N-acetylgalactosaminyltransferase 1-like n=1 Tax=Ostrea edulis TaxID=37623 RepID=UPI0024AE93AB|nr:polypeptide N-acetylgalactosaminyltransferase 1-like [Ostrea edulis]
MTMRLTYRYVVACVVVVLLVCTYQVYIFSHGNSLFSHLPRTGKRTDIVSNVRASSILVNNTSKDTSKATKGVTVTLTADEYRRDPKLKTGNPLIDDYGKNDLTKTGEMGRGVTFTGKEKAEAAKKTQMYNINVMASDLIPLNRLVPDSRPPECKSKTYEHDLPTASIIIPYFDEWPSVLIRSIYSIINRTPRHLLQEIILIDDASTMPEIKTPLDEYVEKNFPKGLVRILRNTERKGLIAARLQGWRMSKGQVVSFFDSHMEVNDDWLQPLLVEIKKDRKTVAMGVLDYVNAETLEYRYNDGYMTRYGFDWRMVFFETFFRQDQIGKTEGDTRPGTVMVGAAYAIDSKYFGEIGSYDEGMKVWGGENLEMAWRVWMCGGRLVHLPCSHLGHIARAQPYSFPGGRRTIEVYNYKRAVEVWVDPEYRSFIYDHFEEMKAIDAGDLSPRIQLKNNLQCKNFTWFIDNVWPELFIYNRNVQAWGSLRNAQDQRCFDNHQYLFQAPERLYFETCHFKLATQGFSLTKDHFLRTSLQCVVLKEDREGARPMLEDCIIGPKDKWTHIKDGYIKHQRSGLCLDVDPGGVVAKTCTPGIKSQNWQFTRYGYELRRYEASQWVATRNIITNYDSRENSQMFFKLFHYISGNNTASMKIPMTAPVVTTYTPGIGMNNQQTVTEMHFMIPHNMQPYPPSPTDSTVYVTMLPTQDVYVKSFGGFTNHMTNLVKVTELKNEINNISMYYDDHFYTAGYDGPYSVNRHNEVWLAAKH